MRPLILVLIVLLTASPLTAKQPPANGGFNHAAHKPEAVKPLGKLRPIKELAAEIDKAILSIGRDKLTSAKADQKLIATLSAFNAKRYAVEMTYTIDDIEKTGYRTQLKLTPLETDIHGLAMIGRDSFPKEIENADKGSVLMISGVLQAYYVNNNNSHHYESMFIGNSEQAALYLGNFKIALKHEEKTDEKKPEEKEDEK